MPGWPLVGRDEELDLVRRRLVDGGHGVVIVAPPGTGKTRLVQAAIRAAAASGPTLSIVGTRSAQSLPLAAVASLLPEHTPVTMEPLDLLRAVRLSLAERAGGRRLVVAVDDAHLLDPLSAALVHHLAITDGLAYLVAVRSGEPVEDAITALWRDGIAERLDLQPLSVSDVGTLLHDVLGGVVETATVRRLWGATGGNPLYLREVVTEAVRVGTLEDAGGLWRWQGEVRVGARLRELVELRLAGLDDEERAVVDLLAVGEELDERIVERACVPSAVSSLRARGFVERESNGDLPVLRLDHPLFADVVRGSLSASENARWCRLLAETVDPASGGDTELLRHAVWKVEGEIATDAEMLIRAAELATKRFDGRLGERLARAALDAGAGDEARLVLAEACLVRGDFAGALAQAQPLEEAALPDEMLARLAMVLAEAGYWGLGLTSEVETALGRIAKRIDRAPARQRIRALQAAVMLAAGDLVPAAELGLTIAADPGADPLARLRAVTAGAAGLSRLGRPADAMVLCESLLPVGFAHAAEMPRGVGWVIAQFLSAFFCVGRFDEAEQLLVPVRDAAIIEGDNEIVGSGSLVLARLALSRGDLLASDRLLREGVAALRGYDPAGYLPWCLGMMAQVAGQRGDAAAARDAMTELDTITWQVHLFDHEVFQGRAWAAAADGEVTAPVTILVTAAAHARAAGDVFTEGLMLHEALRLGAHPRDVVERIEATCATGQLPYHETFAAHARALVAQDGVALDEVTATFERFGLLLMAAEAAVEATAAHRRAAQRARATRAAANAARLRDRCPGARTPALAQLADVPLLTRREREVSRLAAQELTNQEIAEQLLVGVRTVEGHLLRAMTKLGVNRRQDLSRVLDTGDNA
jgi:DNA-binding CsgD family transcriptional regulator